MAELELESQIDASPETVFDYIADPNNHEKFLPSLVEISDVGENDVGKQGRYVYKMVGQSMEGRFADTEFDRPNRRAYDLMGDLEGQVTWTIEAADDGANVHYHQVVDLPGPDLLESITEPIAEKFLQREAESMMENLTMLVEERATSPEQ